MLIRVLGGMKVCATDGSPIELATRKTEMLFATLVVAGRKGVSRETLCELLWPDRAEAQARGSLRQALTALRHSTRNSILEHLRIETVGNPVRLSVDDAQVDIRTFERLSQSSDESALAAAAQLYEGDVLAGISFSGPIEDWLYSYRQALRLQALSICKRLSEHASSAHSSQACERLARILLLTDPIAEEAHRSLIRLHLAGGRANAARQQFEVCRSALLRELGTDPEDETMQLMRPAWPPAETATSESSQASAVSVQRERGQPSIVVLPFDNLSGDTDEYFVDGVVEEITATLSRVRDFFVIARQSAFTYKGRFVDVREIGKEFGVQYVVEGTVRRGGDRLRISVGLVDAETRTQLWSERYEGSAGDLFKFQDEIASQVAGAIHPAIRVAETEAVKRRYPANPKAYDLVMRAFPFIWGRRKDTNDKAIELLREAVSLEHSYGRAHALLAYCYASKASYLWTNRPEDELALALSAVTRAGAISDDPTALTAAGAAMSICGDQERAQTFVEKALSLDPNNAWAWARRGWIGIYTGQPGRAAEWFQRAMALSPMDPFGFNMKIGFAASLAMAGSLREAIEIARELTTSHPDVIMVYRFLATWSAMSNDLQTARWAANKLLEVQPDFTIEHYRSLPFFKNLPEWADSVAEALKSVGLPEH